jgi:hypothetical protein
MSLSIRYVDTTGTRLTLSARLQERAVVRRCALSDSGAVGSGVASMSRETARRVNAAKITPEISASSEPAHKHVACLWLRRYDLVADHTFVRGCNRRVDAVRASLFHRCRNFFNGDSLIRNRCGPGDKRCSGFGGTGTRASPGRASSVPFDVGLRQRWHTEVAGPVAKFCERQLSAIRGSRALGYAPACSGRKPFPLCTG